MVVLYKKLEAKPRLQWYSCLCSIRREASLDADVGEQSPPLSHVTLGDLLAETQVQEAKVRALSQQSEK